MEDQFNKFTHDEIIHLKTALGPLYNFRQISSDSLEIVSPFLNTINDNYSVFIKKTDDHKHPYLVDDDGDALNEFSLMQVNDQVAKDYITKRHFVIFDDLIRESTTAQGLLDAILLNLNTQMGLTALETIAQSNEDDDFNGEN